MAGSGAAVAGAVYAMAGSVPAVAGTAQAVAFWLVGRSGILRLGRWGVAADRRGGILFGTQFSTAHAAILSRLLGRVRRGFGDVAAFGAAIGRGAEIVAAVRAESDALTATRAEDRAKAK